MAGSKKKEKKKLPRFAPCAGGMKFATQIPPLLNCLSSYQNRQIEQKTSFSSLFLGTVRKDSNCGASTNAYFGDAAVHDGEKEIYSCRSTRETLFLPHVLWLVYCGYGSYIYRRSRREAAAPQLAVVDII